jgi:hypothetical protein
MNSSHRYFARAIVWAVALALALGAGVAAPTVRNVSATGHAAITILRPTSTSLTTGLSFGRLGTNSGRAGGGTVTITSAPPAALALVGVERAGGGSGPSPAVYSIKGDKNRAYTVSFFSPVVASSPGSYRVSKFTLWSANSGTITSGGIGHLNVMGTDTLRVGATLTVPGGILPTNFTAVVPITILAQ